MYIEEGQEVHKENVKKSLIPKNLTTPIGSEILSNDITL